MTVDAATWAAVFEHFHLVAAMPFGQRRDYLAKLEIASEVRAEIMALLDADDEFKTGISDRFDALLPTDADCASPNRTGQRLLGFDILNLLGAGSAGQVYRAKDLRLGRHVALKLTRDSVTEARVMALLEHPHIVAVYGVVEAASENLNMICMQFVQGGSLAQLERTLRVAEPYLSAGADALKPAAGQKILDVIGSLSGGDAPLDPSRAEEKARFARLDAIGVVAQIATQLCGALSFAHARGILHLDIKPANILIDQTGRAMIADFGISLELRGGVRAVDATMPTGGTFGYMAPEHRAAFAGEAVTLGPPADVYALGVVCRDLAVALGIDDLVATTIWDAATATALVARLPDMPALAARVGAWAKVAAAERLMPLSPGWGLTARFPWAASEGFLILANLAAAVLQIAYNKVHIIDSLSPRQAHLFLEIVPPWNLLDFSIAYAFVRRSNAELRRAWRNQRELSPAGAAAKCAETMRLAARYTRIVVIFWCISFALFYAALALSGDPLPRGVLAHFFASFVLGAGIASSYSKLSCDAVMIRCVYPRFLGRVDDFERIVARDFATADAGQRWLRLATGAIPLAAAALIVGSGLSSAGQATYDAAIVTLILLGVIGFGGASRLLDWLKAWIAALRSA